MIGLRPCAYVCAYADPIFTSQKYDISILSTSIREELVHVSCAYAYVCVDPVFTCLRMSLCYCLSLYLCASENQASVILEKNNLQTVQG